MGLVTGNLSYRRFRVQGALPEGFREAFVEAAANTAAAAEASPPADDLDVE